jgi:hypothetical protein
MLTIIYVLVALIVIVFLGRLLLGLVNGRGRV